MTSWKIHFKMLLVLAFIFFPFLQINNKQIIYADFVSRNIILNKSIFSNFVKVYTSICIIIYVHIHNM